MTYDHKIKVIWVDFFGVICSEVAPFWFQKYFTREESLLVKEKYFRPVDIGEISYSELMIQLSVLVKKPAKEIDKEFHSFVKIDNQVVSFLEKFRKSYELILCSNANSDFLRGIIKEYNLEHLFDKIIISSEIQYMKPDALFFDKCFAVSECAREEIVFIDDNKVNIDSAKNFGVQTILFTKSEDLLQIF